MSARFLIALTVWEGGVTILALGLGRRLGLLLELLSEGLVVKEDVWIVEFVVPSALEVSHSGDQIVEFLVSDQRDQRRVGAG